MPLGAGLPYRVVDDEIRWVGDQEVDQTVVQPAAAALDDPRLEVTRRHFDAAHDAVRRGEKEARATAATELGSTTEALLDALLEASGMEAPARPGAEAKLRALIAVRPELAEWRELFLLPVRSRNRHGKAHPDLSPMTAEPIQTVYAVTAVVASLVQRMLPEPSAEERPA